MPVLATWSPADATLDALVPIGLAVAFGTALLVDLDPSGPSYSDSYTLADLVRRGPSNAELSPTKKGPAWLANGGVGAEDAAEVVRALADRWPAVVLRCPPGQPRPSDALALLPLLPRPFTLTASAPVAYQRCVAVAPPDLDAPILPRPSSRVVTDLLAGRRPARPDRWLRSLRTLWTMA